MLLTGVPDRRPERETKSAGRRTRYNPRAPLSTTLHQIGLKRLRPINDQYTFEWHAGRWLLAITMVVGEHSSLIRNPGLR